MHLLGFHCNAHGWTRRPVWASGKPADAAIRLYALAANLGEASTHEPDYREVETQRRAARARWSSPPAFCPEPTPRLSEFWTATPPAAPAGAPTPAAAAAAAAGAGAQAPAAAAAAAAPRAAAPVDGAAAARPPPAKRRRAPQSGAVPPAPPAPRAAAADPQPDDTLQRRINSWTAAWGNKGYFKVRRGNDECGVEAS
eukprot:gene5807-9852_t